MEWRGSGTVIGRRPHGEHAAIIDLMTEDLGRLSGLVPGGGGRSKAAMLQPGNRISATWRARREDQLGSISAEPERARSGILSDRAALAALTAMTALLCYALPERDPHPALSARSEALWDALDRGDMDGGADWRPDYIRWEILLLDEVGFGLDLSACALTGQRDGLAYVSPKTGRAVTAAAAGDYAPRLLRLPHLLGGPESNDDLTLGLSLSGHFLHHWLAPHVGRKLPAARDRLAALLGRDSRR